MSVDPQHLRMAEALLFAAVEPLDEATLAARLPEGVDVPSLMEELKSLYGGRGVNLVRVAGKWAFRTAPDLAFLLESQREVPRRLSRAALETLAIIAYHQPVSRSEIEQVRGVSLSRGTLDLLFEAGWIRPKGRRRSPGRPVTYGTTDAFLEHFGLETLADLPGLDELKAAGLLEARLGAGSPSPPGKEDGLPAEREAEDESLADPEPREAAPGSSAD